MIKKIGIILFFTGATLACLPAGRWLAHCLIGKAAFAATQESGQPCPPECVTDSMEIVTWYPSPYNEYEELRLYPTQRVDADCDNYKIGLMYYDHGGTPSFADNDKIRVCKGNLGWQVLSEYWQLSGTDDIYNTNSGNVGIGTISPVQLLELGGGNLLLGRNSSIPSTRYLGVGDPDGKLADGGRAAIEFESGVEGVMYDQSIHFTTHKDAISSARRVTIDPNGNVGIGTTTPSSALQIGGADPEIRLDTGIAGVIPLMIRADNDVPIGWTNPLIRTGGGGSLQIDSTNASGRFGKLYLNANRNSDVFLASGGGNVGIGMQAPWDDSTSQKLHVVGNAYISGNVGIGTTSPQGALDITSTTGAFIVPRMTQAQRDALTAVNGMIIYNTTANRFNFYENGAWQ